MFLKNLENVIHENIKNIYCNLSALNSIWSSINVKISGYIFDSDLHVTAVRKQRRFCANLFARIIRFCNYLCFLLFFCSAKSHGGCSC